MENKYLMTHKEFNDFVSKFYYMGAEDNELDMVKSEATIKRKIGQFVELELSKVVPK